MPSSMSHVKKRRRNVRKLAYPLELTRIRLSIEGLCAAAVVFLAKLQPNADSAGMNHLQFFLLCLAGGINRQQQNVIEYLQEEVKVLKEQLGKKPRFNDDQRRRLATKAEKIGLQRLKAIAAIVTPRALMDWH
jgi:hypothetical protein